MFFTKKLQKHIFVTLILLLLIIEIPIIIAGCNTQPSASDTIIILGAKLIGHTPSALLRLRLDEGIKLYNEGYASTIIVSGAQGKDEEMSEAAGMQSYLTSRGIPAENILLEDKSFNTYQNLTNSQAIMQQKGLQTAIIVSNSSHIRRCLLLAHNLKLQATGAPAPMSNNVFLTTGQYLREGAATAALLFKESK